MTRGEVDIITMGCSKNLVDSEVVARLLQERGYHPVFEPRLPRGEYVVVNTCGFIQDAKQESIDTILTMAERKRKGQIGKLIVMGCLSGRYGKELEDALPEVDRFYGKLHFVDMVKDLPRPRQTPPHYAYVKVSEGCDRHCAFCAIPIITGRHRSRPMEEILSEVRHLAQEGVKEVQVIAQELTSYGMDLTGRRQIAELVDRMADIEGIEWLRLHYAYPKDFPMELLDVMARRRNVCRYLDIAFQHVSDQILNAMHRHFTARETYALIDEMRRRVPGLHLRTTLMVGYPGETDEDFDSLLEFVRRVRFERMGAFAYSEEDGTWAQTHLVDNVPQTVKQERLDRLMALQQEISEELQAQSVGQTMRVMIDRCEGTFYVGRTEFSSPEVDPEVLILMGGKQLRRGHFYDVKITGSAEFDLFGEVVN